MNISNNAKLPVYATGDSSFQSNMQVKSRPFRQTNTGVKFYELFNEFYESVDIQIVEVIVQIRDVDQFGVSEIYPDKTGGQLITNFQYERSIHDGETRDTYEVTGAVLDAETTFILKTNGFSTNDQLSIKRRGGPHNDTHPKAGRCYAIGAGTNGDPHLAKEFPAHPNTPKFKKPIVIEPGMPANIGDLKNKLIGIKAVDYNIENNTKVMLEVWIDLDPLDAAGKPKNNWKKWWHAIDDGNWDDGDGNEEGGPPYLSLQGVTGGETSEKIYLRMDNVTNKAVATMSSCREINPTGVIVEHPCTDPNAHKDPTSGICVCNFGFHMENGVCVKDTSPVCPDENSHWDNALQKCVCNAGFHDVNGVCVPVVMGNVLYDSNIQGKWKNGHARLVEDFDPDCPKPFVNAMGLEMHASGSPRLKIDGNGEATLEADKGHGRYYCDVINYKAFIEYELRFNDTNIENHTCQLQSRHQEGGVEDNRFGGLSFKIDRKTVGLKIEKFHNEHETGPEKNLPKEIAVGQWVKVRNTPKVDNAAHKINQKIEIDYNDGAGFREVIANEFTNAADYYTDPTKFLQRSIMDAG